MISIEVVIPRSNIDAVYPVLCQCCKDVGDVMLGSRSSSLTGEMLVIVCLTNDKHVFAHLTTLTQALEDEAIVSFQFIQGCIVKATGAKVKQHLSSFPFSLGDIWLPALNDEQSVYLCLHRRLLTPQQSAWFLIRPDVKWSYM